MQQVADLVYDQLIKKLIGTTSLWGFSDSKCDRRRSDQECRCYCDNRFVACGGSLENWYQVTIPGHQGKTRHQVNVWIKKVPPIDDVTLDPFIKEGLEFAAISVDPKPSLSTPVPDTRSRKTVSRLYSSVTPKPKEKRQPPKKTMVSPKRSKHVVTIEEVKERSQQSVSELDRMESIMERHTG